MIKTAIFGAISAASVPNVIFHGLNDNCQNNMILVDVIKNATQAPTYCIEIGQGAKTTWLHTIINQAEEACENVKNHPILGKAPEINTMGFSQGGFMARYIAEACNIKGKVRNLMTVGTPNMGYVDAPKCQDFANLILSHVVNSDVREDWVHQTFQEFICSIGTWILQIFVVHFSFTYVALQQFLGPSDYYRLPDEMS